MLKSVASNKWIYLGSILSLLFFVTIGHYLALSNQRQQQLDFSRLVLDNSERISQQLADSLRAVNQAGLVECTKPVLDKIRVIASRFPYVGDIGIIQDEKLACSADWGILVNPVSLPRHSFLTTSGFEIYIKPTSLLPSNVVRDMTRLGNTVAFTSELLTHQVYQGPEGVTYELVTQDGKNAFFKLLDMPAGGNSLTTLSTRLCSEQYDFCVITHNERAGLLAYKAAPLTFYILFSLCLGGLIAFATTSFQEEKKSLEFRLKRAIQRNELYLEYQPVVHAHQHNIVGMEALLRWKDDLYGQVSPELFIPVATKLDIYGKISTFIVSRALDEVHELLEKDEKLTISLNVSTYEINAPDYLDRLQAQVLRYDLKPTQIKLEITERINEYHQKIADFTTSAREKGFKISLDDFGTGSSNILWLTAIDFDEIKLDKIFINGLHEELKKDLFTSMLQGIAKLNKQIVFEGVESPHELRLIESFDRHALIQGWVFYKAMPVKRLAQAIQERNHPGHVASRIG